jgi:predicted RNase H-like HicB family nuclease
MVHQTAARKSSANGASHKARNSHGSGQGGRRRRSGDAQEHLQPSRSFTFTKEGYAVIFARTRTGYAAHSPDVLGCIATGRTLAQVKKLFQSALRMHLDAMLEDGDPIPQALTKVGYAVA